VPERLPKLQLAAWHCQPIRKGDLLINMTASSLQTSYTCRRTTAGRKSGRAAERAVALLREWRRFDDRMLEDIDRKIPLVPIISLSIIYA
jgi:hypothetical protein